MTENEKLWNRRTFLENKLKNEKLTLTEAKNCERELAEIIDQLQSIL